MRNVPSKRSVVFLSVLALIAGCLIPLTFAPPAMAASEFDWVDAGGPGNGDAMALVSDNVHGIIYRATVGSAGNTEFGKGVWKYQAGAWTSLGGAVASLGITTLAYDSAGDRLYAGSNGQGIWCYNPSDGTWAETNYIMRAYDVTALAFGGGKLYAGLWDPEAAPGSQGMGVQYYDPTDPTGAWTDTGTSLLGFRIRSLAWGGDRLYAGPDDIVGWPQGVWYYDPASPAADKWTDTDGGMYHRRATALAWDGTNNLLYSSAGFTGVWYYNPALPTADKWTYAAGSVGSFEVTSLAWGEGKLYAGCISAMGEGNKGVWCYDPASPDADKWTDTGGGLNAFEMKSLAFDTYHHHLFAGTTQDGVWRYNLANSPPTWSDTRGGVSTSYVNCLAYDSTSRLLYVGTDSDGVWCYDPATATWTDIGGGVSSFETICLAFGGGKLYAGCFDHNAPAYKGVWCYDPASPGPDKWTDTGGTAKAIHNLVYDDGRGKLYAGTGEKYTDNGGQGVWCYNPASSGWTDISGGDIDAYNIDSLALGGDRLYAGCYDINTWWLGVWQYNLAHPEDGWTNTGGGVSTFEISALAWSGDKLYAGCWDWTQPISDVGEGVWCYDPIIPAPDKWSSTGGSMNPNLTYALAWDGENEKLYTSCVKWFTARFDGVWGYDPASPDADKWWDTGGGVGSYYVSSLVYDEDFHRLYAGTGGEGVFYYGAPPVIDSLDPVAGGVGSEVTVSGLCFGPGGTGSEYVTIGGVPAVVKPGTWTDGSVVCYVPAGVTGTVPVTVYNLNGASNQAGFTVLAQRTITASVSGGHGKVSPASQSVNYGSNASIDLVPASGYHVASITDNGAAKTVADPYVISNVRVDHTVVVTFAEDTSPLAVWYLAEGSTNWGFDCYVSIENPNPEAVSVKLTYMTGAGPMDGPTVPMPPKSQATVYPAATLGASDFSTKVECLGGKAIAVDRTMFWTGPGAACAEAHCATGVTSAATTWYMPEGSSKWGFECYLLIQNPGDDAANCQITWMIEGEAAVTSGVAVPANSRATYSMAGFIGAKDASIKITSDTPVIPERAMYRNNRREGHDSGGTTTAATDYYLAEGCTGFGFTTYVLIQNPQATPTDVTITYQAAAGPVPGPSFQMPANSRRTICVNDSTAIPGPDPSFSTRVHGSQPLIAERAMYWRGGADAGEVCHYSIGLDKPHTSWYLADGQTTDGRETFTLVQNPNATDVSVEVTYMTPDGVGNVTRTETIAANSRRTFGMADHAGISGRAAIMVTSTTAGKKIMVERAMYWNSRGTGTDTIGGYSD